MDDVTAWLHEPQPEANAEAVAVLRGGIQTLKQIHDHTNFFVASSHQSGIPSANGSGMPVLAGTRSASIPGSFPMRAASG